MKVLGFDSAAVEHALRREIAGVEVLWRETSPSTNLELRESAKAGAAGWTVLVAGMQTRGRGRYTRTWASPPGGLYLSVLLRLAECGSPVTLLPLLAGLAVKDGIESELARLGGGAFHGWLKWPNDLITPRGKLAGVLCEAARQNDIWEIIAGIGLNVVPVAVETGPAARKLDQKPACLELEHPGVPWTRENLLIAVLRGLYEWVGAWERDPARVREAWLDASGVVGKPIEATSPGETIRGVARGINELGALLIETTSGMRELNAAEALIIH